MTAGELLDLLIAELDRLRADNRRLTGRPVTRTSGLALEQLSRWLRAAV